MEVQVPEAMEPPSKPTMQPLVRQPHRLLRQNLHRRQVRRPRWIHHRPGSQRAEEEWGSQPGSIHPQRGAEGVRLDP
jgi:hypothetical protein